MNELYHHGILGMKWGVRRYQNEDGTWTPAGQKRYGKNNPDYNKAHIKKSVKQMSDKELRDINNRLNMEKQYKQLNPNTVQKGLAAVGAVGAGLGTVYALYTNGNNVINAGKKIVEHLRRN